MSTYSISHSSYAGAPMPNNYGSLVSDLLDNNSRENALAELSKQREQLPDLAVILWNRFGTRRKCAKFEFLTPSFLGVVTVLIHEIISAYPLLVPPGLNSATSTRVCNALALLQCIASHEATRSAFLQAHIPLYLYPFLNTTSKTRPFEYLRLTSLGVIGALVKSDNSDVIDFLLSTEIIPLCLRIMETGNELSRTVAIFIVQKILLDNIGLGYVCQTYERFHAVVSVLNSMVQQLQEQKSLRLLKHIIRCYLRLTDNKKALEGLKQVLPSSLRDGSFKVLMAEDANTTKFYEDLVNRLA